MTQPLPGDFFVTATYGSKLDRFLAFLIRWGTNSPVNHAGIFLGDNSIIEAEPGGARISQGFYDNCVWSTGHIYLDDDERTRIVYQAKLMRGVPYSWLDIIAITLAQKRLGGRINSNSWIAKRISSDKTLTCAELCDRVYQLAGIHLFADGRLSGLVSPGDLYGLIRPGVPSADAGHAG